MGEIAALLTAGSWAFASVVFTTSGKLIGTLAVNRLRLLLAALLLAITHLIVSGSFLPLDAAPDRWLWLGLSGVVGLVLGDLALLQGFVMVGPRLSMLMMASVPVVSTLLAWIFLGEQLGLAEVAGIFLTAGGIAWVVLEHRNGEGARTDRRHYVLGILFALGGAAGQSVGLILAKKGLYGDFSSLSAVLIRMTVAALVIWLLALFTRQAGYTLLTLKEPVVQRTVPLGTLIGSYVGVWLSVVAVQQAFVGVASTLMALTPIMLLPYAHWALKERISLRTILGTVIAMVGVGMIFMLA